MLHHASLRGYNIGVRLVDEFLAKAKVSCVVEGAAASPLQQKNTPDPAPCALLTHPAHSPKRTPDGPLLQLPGGRGGRGAPSLPHVPQRGGQRDELERGRHRVQLGERVRGGGSDAGGVGTTVWRGLAAFKFKSGER